MHEGPTENRLGELGSLYKCYYYFYYYCLVKNAIVDLTVRLKENTKCISGNSLSLLGAQNRHNGAASQTLLTEVKLRLRRRLPLQRSTRHLRNEKVMGAKIRPAMISGMVTRDSPFSCWPTCHVSMILATVPEVFAKVKGTGSRISACSLIKLLFSNLSSILSVNNRTHIYLSDLVYFKGEVYFRVT